MPSFVTRYYDFSCAHRSMNDPGRCSRIHGHNYRVHLTIGGEPNAEMGRVFDFGLMQKRFFQFIEDQWDHRFLVYMHDPILNSLKATDNNVLTRVLTSSIVWIDFDPSTENMAKFLGQCWQRVLDEEHNRLGTQHPRPFIAEVRIEETRKCSASWQPE